MLFVIESIDGGGKGAQRENIVRKLLEKGYDIEGIEFPYKGKPISIYNYLIHDALHEKRKLNNESWFLAFMLEKTLFKERLDEVKGNKKKHIVCDGYFTTTLVYQSLLDSAISLEKALELGNYFRIPEADLNIYLSVDVEIALKRKRNEEGHEEGLDKNEGNINKQMKIAEGFNFLAKENIWGPWEIVDGNKTLEEVSEAILQNISKII